MRVAVVGIGHVGLVVAASLADMGHEVRGVDQPSVVAALNRGETLFFEPGLTESVARNVKEGRLFATTRLEDVADCEIIWIAIGTNQTSDGAIVIPIVEKTVAELGELCSSSTVIAIKSTMPIGSCRRMAERLPADGPILTSNPEFLRQGSAIADFFKPGKTVVGAGPRGGTEVLARVYEAIPGPKYFTNWETAESVKLAQNAFNALRISYMNELSLTLDGLDVSLELVSQALREDEAALRRYLSPGFSYGGSCLPNNVDYLRYLARSRGYAAPLLHAVKAVNDLRVSRLCERIAQEIGGLEYQCVAIWGLTYKADTDDLRSSPSVWLADMLQKAGARVLVFDPNLQAAQVEKLHYTHCQTAEESLLAADALVVLTRCPEFASVPAETITNALSIDRVFDVVGALPDLRKTTLNSRRVLDMVGAMPHVRRVE